MAEIYSLCHICGKVAGHTCKLCGKPACDKHFDKNTGVCSAHGASRDLKGKIKS